MSYAINFDENKYIESYSDKVRNPESVLVNEIPNESDPEKMRCYRYINGEFVFDADKWAAIEAQRAEQEAERAEAARINGINAEIDSLKNQIGASDYQIIKCYEYFLNDLPMPYDVKEIHEERQAMRDKINELEEELKAEE